MENSSDNQCFRTALRILGRREHSTSELTEKLKGRGFAQATIETAIDECRRLNYINDERFSQSYIRKLHTKGLGAMRVEQMLKSKGVPEELVAAADKSHFSYEAQCALCRRVLAKKINAAPQRNDRTDMKAENKAKLYRFLLGRGFAGDVVRQVLNAELGDKTD